METAGFYKYYEDNPELSYGPNYVLGPYQSYSLYKEQHDTYTYPVDGWYWFDSQEEAYAFFNLPIPTPPDLENPTAI